MNCHSVESDKMLTAPSIDGARQKQKRITLSKLSSSQGSIKNGFAVHIVELYAYFWSWHVMKLSFFFRLSYKSPPTVHTHTYTHRFWRNFSLWHWYVNKLLCVSIWMPVCYCYGASNKRCVFFSQVFAQTQWN